MVDRAKHGYVSVRKREYDIESNDALEEEKKKSMIDFMKDEKKWAYEGLVHEVNEFNEVCKFADDNFDQFLFNKDDFHIQMEVKCKKGFFEVIDEAKRLNDNIFDEMKTTTDRILKEIEELNKIGEAHQIEKAVGNYDENNKDILEEKDGKEENDEEGEEKTELTEKEPEGENENIPPNMKRGVTRGPRITAEKIIEFIDKALELQKSGIEDDDAHTNEISSLTNQFKYINKNMKQSLTTKLSNFISGKSNSASDLKHFLTKVLQGAPVLDHQIEKVTFFLTF